VNGPSAAFRSTIVVRAAAPLVGDPAVYVARSAVQGTNSPSSAYPVPSDVSLQKETPMPQPRGAA